MTNKIDILEARANEALYRVLESNIDLWDSYVDPREAYLGPDGEFWSTLGAGTAKEDQPYQTLQELFQIQTATRFLWRENGFAINGHKNRQNYIVGTGHQYTVVPKTDTVNPDALTAIQDFLDDILEQNRWANRQDESLMRGDRDGEVFYRTFRQSDGTTLFRFIEPKSIVEPGSFNKLESFGIGVDDDDFELALAYNIDGEGWIDADQIQHRKYNVDSSMKRGYPLFYPVRKNLMRAVKLLQNMSVATEIQNAIALIRKHKQSTEAATRSFINAKAEDTITDSRGNTESVLKYGAGSILDASKNVDYQIPPQMDPSKTISALQAELRAIASHVVMPEFMLTSDASNANFSSTMVAEGPAVKNFEKEQAIQIEFDLELLNDAMNYAAKTGRISASDWQQCCIDVQGPSVKVRDQLQEAQIRQIDMGLNILSPQTATAESGRDYDQEQTNIDQHQERQGGLPIGTGKNEFSRIEPDGERDRPETGDPAPSETD